MTNNNILIIGAGISGIEAALTLGDQGYRVILVEKTPSVGGRMAQLDKTFPTLDCSICILAPKMVEVSRHPNVVLLAYSEIQEVSGQVGNFNVKILKKARYVNWDVCTGCAACTEKCPMKKIPSEFEEKYAETLKEHNVDLVCLAGFMRIIKTPLLEAFKGKILNIHPALLPSFPGLEVQKKAIDYGVKFSGCTVHFVTADVDAGPIVTQAVVPVMDADTPETLAARILKEEHRIYTEAINILVSGKYRIEGRRVIKT